MFKLDRDAGVQLWGGLKRVFTLGDLGIAPRLALAFASVAVLAAASNFLVESGVAIVESVTRPRPTLFSPELLSREIGAQGPAYEKADARVKASRVVLSLGKFDKAVGEYGNASLAESQDLYARARTEFRRTAKAFEKQYVRIAGAPPRALLAGFTAHERNAEALMQAAGDQRSMLASHAAIFARMNERLHRSMDSAAKFMGGVKTRQSLLKLTTQLAEIQNRFATRNVPGNGDGQASLRSAEQALADTLRQGEAELRRSHGAEWFSAMRGDFESMQTSRASLALVEQRQALLARQFSSETEKLAELLARIPDKNLRQAAAVPPQPAAHAPLQTTAAVAQPLLPEARSRSRSSLVAWVTVIVLGVLAYICVITTVSVVRPVRRLIRATARLAAGRDVPPVPQGGIRELNTLSQAFNSMAEQLAASRAANREAKHLLEARVEERTRQLQELAERDPLTGLANRRQLFAALNSSIGRTASTGRLVGAYFLDVDNFKTLNDSMGHAFGDRVLTAIARRLETVAASFGFAARLGGDEFMLVHEGAASIDEILASGNSIVEAFQEPIQVDDRELIVSVSVGASVYPQHADDAEALLRAADAALFDAKALGRNRLTIFTPELLVRASIKFGIEQRLRRAVEKGEFELFYQPEVSIRNLEVNLVEALLRWRMPDGTYQCPGEFLAVAEESGLILGINDWVLRTAIRTASQWHHGPWPEARVAVNVSPRQFLDYRFVEKLEGLLTEHRLPARCLELELTESVLQTGPTTIATIARLREMGIAIALDDFGTGYSSIASLEQLPLTRIKLDRSLIARMDTNPRSASIARATIGLCSELGLDVTAEGVERLEQFAALLGYSGMSLQGYLIAAPMSRESVLASVLGARAHCEELVLLSHKLEPGANESVFSRAIPFAVPASGPTKSHPPRKP